METKAKLRRAFQQLIRLADKGRLLYGPIECGLYLVEPEIWLPEDVWASMDQYYPDDIIPMQSSYWVDGQVSQGIRWWGDRRGIEEFQRWGDDAYVELVNSGLVTSQGTNIRGYHRTVRFLFDSARSHAELSALVSIYEVEMGWDLATVRNYLAENGHTSATFRFLWTSLNAISFAQKVLRKIDGAEMPARLSVDIDNDTATCHGKTYGMRRQALLVLDVLVGQAGEIVSRRSMRDTHLELSEDRHLERQIEHLRKSHPAIGDLIESIPAKGYRIASTHVD